MNKIRKVMLALAVCGFLTAAPAPTFAGIQTVVNSRVIYNGSSKDYTEYGDLPVNYVQLKALSLSNAVIESGPGYHITRGYIGATLPEDYKGILYWQGKVRFGQANRTNDSNASLQNNKLPDVTLRFPKGAKLSDGTEADVRVEIRDISKGLGKSRVSSINNDTVVKVPVMNDWAIFCSTPPRTTFDYREGSADNGRNAGCTVATRLKTRIQIVYHGTETPVSEEKYPAMLVMFRDMDVPDNTIKRSTDFAARCSGPYAEGIEMEDGWGACGSKVVLPPVTGDIANTCLVNTQTVSGCTKIKVDGNALKKYMDAYGHNDNNTLWSGCVTAVRPQGYSFSWTGAIGGSRSGVSYMGTSFAGQPTVAVSARRNDPGAGGAVLGGNGAKSGRNEWHTNTHLMNSDFTYDFRPDSENGWMMKSLRVDGAEQPLNEEQVTKGGTYTFNKLNKSPLPERNIRTGAILASGGSGIYTLEASYIRKPEYRAVKTSDTAYLHSFDDAEITYIIRCDELYKEAAGGRCRITDDLAKGLLKLSEKPEVKVSGGTYVENKADDTGLDYTFISDEADGTAPHMLITYRAKVNWPAFFASDRKDIVNLCSSDDPGDPDDETKTGVLSSLRVTKEVSGKLRDMTKYFEFTLSLSGLEPDHIYAAGSGPEFGTGGGAEIVRAEAGTIADNGIRSDGSGNIVCVFRMKHGQGLGIKDIPAGTEYSVEEGASDHKPSYVQTSDADSPVFIKASDETGFSGRALSTEKEVLDKQDGEVTIAFNNRRDPVTVTGLPADATWLIAAALALAAAAAVSVSAGRAEAADSAEDKASDKTSDSAVDETMRKGRG